MASGQCDYCFTRLRTGSPLCPRCGRKKKHTKRLLAGLVVVQAAVIACFMHFSVPSIPAMAHVVTDAAPQEIAWQTAHPPAGWYYFQTTDELVHDITKHARIISVNTMRSDSLRGTTGVLELRASPIYGSSVVITLKRDPLDKVDEQCELRATFDAGAEQVFRASGSVDATDATLVVDDTTGFTGRLAAAHSLTLVAQLSEKSERMTNFAIGGLSWN